MAKHVRTVGVLIAAGVFAASPAGAVKDFSPKTLGKGTGTVVLYGSPHGVDNKPINGRRVTGNQGKTAVSSVPEPRRWLLMLVGFGLLGAVSRRSAPHPLSDELGL